jgi:hypothetical protein
MPSHDRAHIALVTSDALQHATPHRGYKIEGLAASLFVVNIFGHDGPTFIR